MANSPQAKKRVRQNTVRFELRKSQKSALRTKIKNLRSLIQAGKLPEAQAAFKETVKTLSQLAAKKALHRSKASRLTSRLNARIKKLALEQAA